MIHVKSYDIFLDLEFKALKFVGKVIVAIESTEDVLLHSLGLTITNVRVDGTPRRFTQKDENLTIHTGRFSGRIEIDYAGTIPETLVGLYQARYDETYLLTTQFEATNARRMFPCVDHPVQKAEFKLAIRVDSDLDAISNMPIESVQEADGKKIVRFQKTPKMSTYLLYLGVGQFDELKATLGKTELVVATTPGNARRGAFALDVAKRSIAFYQSYFGIPFMLPKLHLIMVPEFAAGAMENWGAITFRETALSVDANSDIKTKKRVAEVVAHELAHMWFGNLVTMKWWDDLWLNESFATFMAFKTVNALQPKWRIWQDFLRMQTSGALARDGLTSTHPIEVAVSSPSEIEQLFDAISYGKGANILRMIEAYVGAEDFRQAVETFLHRYKFANADGSDFWNSFEDTRGQRIRMVVNQWITKPGFPIVTASIRGENLVLKQERFLLSGATEKTVWPIPIVMKLDNESHTLLFENEEQVLNIEGVTSLTVNVDHVGFYRVHYDQALYDRLWSSDLSPLDRWGILSDALALLVAEKMSFDEYVHIIKRFYREHDYLPALEVSDQLTFLYAITPSRIADVSKTFHRSQLTLLDGKTDENSVMLTGIVAERLGRLDNVYATELGAQFHEYGKVEPNMKRAVAVAYAQAYNDFEAIVKKYRESVSDEDRVRLLASLMSFKEPTLLALSLGFALSGDVKRQDLGTVLLLAVGNPETRDVTWTWLKVNIGLLTQVFEGTGTLSRILFSVIPLLGLGKVGEVESFFDEHRIRGAEKGIEAGLERLRIYDRLAQHLSKSV